VVRRPKIRLKTGGAAVRTIIGGCLKNIGNWHRKIGGNRVNIIRNGWKFREVRKIVYGESTR